MLELLRDRTVRPARLHSLPSSLCPQFRALLRRLRDRKTCAILHGISLAVYFEARVFTYTDDATVFVSHLLDIIAVQQALARYELVVGAKINAEKSYVSSRLAVIKNYKTVQSMLSP